MSFSVKDDYFNCFKYSESGDVVQFVGLSQGLNFIESMKFLGGKVGISTESNITRTAGNEPKVAAKMYLNEVRKLDVPDDWYTQEAYGHGNGHSVTCVLSLVILIGSALLMHTNLAIRRIFRKALLTKAWRGSRQCKLFLRVIGFI